MKLVEVKFGSKKDLESEEFKETTKEFSWENLPWSRKWEYPFAILESSLRPGLRVLDTGTGHACGFPYALLEKGCIVSCVDREKINPGRGINALQCDIKDLPFSNEYFDRVFCISVLEHAVGSPINYIEELSRVLKKGGVLVVTFDYNRWDLGFRFKYGEVEVLLSKFGGKVPEMPVDVLKSEEFEDGKKAGPGLSVIGCVFRKE